MNQIACPHCRGVISGQGIAPGQLLVCPHCGRQFVRPGEVAAAPQAAPLAASAPARVPTAAPAAARTGGGDQLQVDTGYASQYIDQRQTQASKAVIWIVLTVVVCVMLLGLLLWAIVNSQMGKIRGDIEPQLYTEANKHVFDHKEKMFELLDIPPLGEVKLKDHHVDFGDNQATVYLEVTGRNKFITVKFRLRNGEWSIDGSMGVKNRK